VGAALSASSPETTYQTIVDKDIFDRSNLLDELDRLSYIHPMMDIKLWI
jgi:hypothetical protein